MASYSPTPALNVDSIETLLAYVQGELEQIASAFTEVTEVELRPINREPDKPRDGMIVFADGTNWDPGAGRGVYVFDTGAWAKL